MGFEIKFNWVLQVEASEVMEVGRKYTFEKEGNRAFPLNVPIDLMDLNRKVVCKIKILEFTNRPGQTKGFFQVLKIYSGVEKEILSQYWLENI